MKLNLCNTVHKMAFFTVIDSYRQKKKKQQQHGSGREWESFFRKWNGIFLQFFRGIGTGRD